MRDNPTTDALNEMLRGEISAVETYQQALDKVGLEEGAGELRLIREDHIDAANTLRRHVHAYGGETDRGSGAWGTFAKAVEGTAKLFGNAAAIKALKKGEELGISSYESALKDDEFPPECKDLVRSTLLPQTRRHVQVLERMVQS